MYVRMAGGQRASFDQCVPDEVGRAKHRHERGCRQCLIRTVCARRRRRSARSSVNTQYRPSAGAAGQNVGFVATARPVASAAAASQRGSVAAYPRRKYNASNSQKPGQDVEVRR